MGDRLGTLGAVGFPFVHDYKRYLRFLAEFELYSTHLLCFWFWCHLKIHGNWSKFKETPFSRGFVALFETFWRFFKVSEIVKRSTLNTYLDEREVLTTITKVVPPGRGCSIALRSFSQNSRKTVELKGLARSYYKVCVFRVSYSDLIGHLLDGVSSLSALK